MSDVTGRAPDQTGALLSNKNSTGAIGIAVLAVAPQIVEIIWSIAGLILRSGGRNPVQAFIDHAYAIATAIPSLLAGQAVATNGGLSEVLLAQIYTFPLLAVAAFTYFAKLRAPQDYFGGIVLMAIALFALWASSDLQGMKGFSFGPGSAPRMFGILLLLLGLGVAITGLLTDGAPLQTYGVRGPLFVTLAILSFSLTIRPLGLVISAMLSFVISALGTAETKWPETIIVGICLTIGCSLLFPYALGLPLELFPRVLR